MIWRLLNRPIFLFLLTTTAVACQTAGYRVIGPEQAGGPYSVSHFTMQMGGDASGICTAAAHTKFFNESGFLGVCGFILNAEKAGCGDNYIGQQLTDAVFEDSTLLIGETVISKAGFYTLRPSGTTADNVVPTCVRTQTPWRDIYIDSKPTLKYSGYTEIDG
jgi:hypothetical protein